jgi:hypothetical protein
MVKVVIDGNQLVMEHAQVLEHKCWYTDAETQKLNHRCWNTDAGTQMLKHRRRRLSRLSVMTIGWLWSTHKRCWNIGARTQMLEHRCWNTNAGSQMQKHNAETELELMLKHSAVTAETQQWYIC